MNLYLGVKGSIYPNISAIHPTEKAFKNFHDVTPRLTEIIPYVKESVDLVADYGTE